MKQNDVLFSHASRIMALVALAVILKFDLLVGLLAACATYGLASALPKTRLFCWAGRWARLVSILCVAAIPVLMLVIAGGSLAYLAGHAHGAHADAMKELTRIVAQCRGSLPAFLANLLPSGPDTVQPWLAGVVHSQAEKLTNFGKSGAHGLLMAVVGVVIGLLMANVSRPQSAGPLALAIVERSRRLQTTFRAIVVAQFGIAAINTALSAMFFFAVLPLMGAHLPYAMSLVVLTFFSSMLPVVGNLLCNTITVIVALTVGPLVALASFVFLVLVHKLEYIVNARVVGSRLSMSAWELLAAMFVLEALFGIPGIVAAPLFYAYVKSELRDLGWV